MSQLDLLDTIRSNDLSSFQCIDLLRNHSGNIGIHHLLVKRLRSFTYDDLEFFIPQFIQLIVAFETNSMALEDFLIDYCSKYPHFSLIVFWNLQAFIFELRNEPESYSFQVVRKFINKLQNILFTIEHNNPKKHEFRENLQPALILSASIASSFGVPRMNEYVSPLIVSQSKQQKSFVFKLANFQKSLTKNLTMKNQRLSTEATAHSDEENIPERNLLELHQRSASVPRLPTKKNSSTFSSDESEAYTTDEEDLRTSIESKRDATLNRINRDKYHDLVDNMKVNTVIKSKKSLKFNNILLNKAKGKNDVIADTDSYNLNSQSLPDLSKVNSKGVAPYLSSVESESSLPFSRASQDVPKRHNSQYSRSSGQKETTYQELLKTLQVNYAKKETSFMMALQNISLRLSQIPKEARLSALRAELSIINETLLPSEIDIPQLLPVTSNKNKKYHKILKLSVNEACVLNSAERVPFLLLIEYLSDEFDFNPFSESNQSIITERVRANLPKTRTVSSSSIIDKSTQIDSVIPHAPGRPHGDDAIIVNTDTEADLSDLPILSQKSSINDLSTLRISSSLEKTANESSTSNTNSPIIGQTDSTSKTLADQMRIASVMLNQLESSGQSSSEHSLSIRTRIVESMISLQDQFDAINYEKLNELKGSSQDAGQRKLENDFKLAEDWNTKKQRIKQSSVYGHLPNWDLCSVIAKNGDDLPQEAFACQLITMISNIWKKNSIGAWTKRMKILITSANTGLVETINNAMSIHSIKKSLTELSISEGENAKGRIFTLQDYFVKMYGSSDSQRFKRAQDNFARSLAAYSIICYVLQIKDRHNGNIMIDNEGHIIHIDFGFLLSNSPGNVGFEAAPFKLTLEYVELLGGIDSPMFLKFKELCKKCFQALRKESDQIINIVELMQKDSNLPCFNNGDNTCVLLKQRLQLHLSEQETDLFVENTLINRSVGSMYTRLYDQFQMITQGIYS